MPPLFPLMSHKYLLTFLLCLAPASARAQIAAPTTPPGIKPTPLPLSARQHADELARVEKLLRADESSPRRSFNPLRSLENPRIVTRDDGATAEVDGSEWRQRRLDATDLSGEQNARVSRGEIQSARESVESRREALEVWAFPPGGKYFQSDSGAKDAIAGWARTGEIQTGPPEWQKAWLSFVKSVYGAFESLLSWVGSWIRGLFTRTASSAPPIRANARSIEIFFYILLAGIVAGAVFLAWRALGGRGWKGARRVKRDILLEGEDAALLRLPPDELLDRAARFAREGNFREALRHRFLSLLLLLDARGVWRYDRRRTNWEHIARLKSSGAPQSGIEALSDLTLRFDRVRYGNASADEAAWLRFDAQALQVLEALGRHAGTPNTSGSSSTSASSGVRR